jgi:hypothetical protein
VTTGVSCVRFRRTCVYLTRTIYRGARPRTIARRVTILRATSLAASLLVTTVTAALLLGFVRGSRDQRPPLLGTPPLLNPSLRDSLRWLARRKRCHRNPGALSCRCHRRSRSALDARLFHRITANVCHRRHRQGPRLAYSMGIARDGHSKGVERSRPGYRPSRWRRPTTARSSPATGSLSCISSRCFFAARPRPASRTRRVPPPSSFAQAKLAAIILQPARIRKHARDRCRNVDSRRRSRRRVHLRRVGLSVAGPVQSSESRDSHPMRASVNRDCRGGRRGWWMSRR